MKDWLPSCYDNHHPPVFVGKGLGRWRHGPLLGKRNGFISNSSGELFCGSLSRVATDLPLKLYSTSKGYVARQDIKKRDKETLEGRLKSTRWRHQKSQPLNWKPYYCVLLQDDGSFTHFPTEEMSIGERLFLELPRVRLDGGRQAFRRRWGYDMGVPSVPEEDEDSSELSETTSLRDERLLRFSSIGEW
ncbi:hypothetical protein JTE90_021050 [Oedothorax gibbosus]|uniref:PH domain-containing protein n=1 Tax=Oedothorax gibbosus TaxID=931172 RepID=A0AAV6VT96_9ARAC|nr:hypothetical protein JTE90_021050 [Oedothorax gibbosus]